MGDLRSAEPEETAPYRALPRIDRGVEANARLTAMTAVVLLVLLAFEGLTVTRT
jgi:hypothetical protein